MHFVSQFIFGPMKISILSALDNFNSCVISSGFEQENKQSAMKMLQRIMCFIVFVLRKTAQRIFSNNR